MDPNWALTRKRLNLEKRARILHRIRAFFMEAGYLEVSTPHRVPANAPESYIDPVGSEGWYLHTSPELCMKRLLAAGYERIFQICPCWRGQERGSRHLPEFTMLEWYRTDIDYNSLMDECEALLTSLVPDGTLRWQGQTLRLESPWERLTVSEAFHRYGSVSLEQALATETFDEVIAFEIEPKLGCERPTFLTEYPGSLAALARRKPGQPEVAERFELYVLGMELANAFSELTDASEQRQRFEAEESRRQAAGKPPYPLAEKFLTELPLMPESAGIALGLDRLVMLLTDANTIDEVVAFTPEEL